MLRFWLGGPRPTTPIYVPDPRRPSLLFVFTSPQVLLSLVLLTINCYALMMLTGDTPFQGSKGLWQLFARKDRARLQNREAEHQASPPLSVSFDMLVMVMCVLTSSGFLNACSSVLIREQYRIENEAEAQWLAAMTDPETRSAALAKGADELAAKIKFWEANDALRRAGKIAKRERIKKLDVMADDVMTNSIVIVAGALSIGASYYIGTQPPSAIRGGGLVAMLMVLIGGLVVCGLDRRLVTMGYYCSIANALGIGAVFTLMARASIYAN